MFYSIKKQSSQILLRSTLLKGVQEEITFISQYHKKSISKCKCDSLCLTNNTNSKYLPIFPPDGGVRTDNLPGAIEL